MQKIIADCESEGTEIILHTRGKATLPDGEYSVTFEGLGEDKSRRQVNYFWKLVREIAIKCDGNASDVEHYYLTLLQEAQVKFEGFEVIEEALPTFKRFCKHFVATPLNNGKYDVSVFPGVSEMNKEEMQTLIEITINRASKLGIPTDYWNEVLK